MRGEDGAGGDGQPWFIHGVGFDITDLKRAETALQEERNLLSGILDTVGALVVVLSPSGEIVRFNRACEMHQRPLVRARCEGSTFWDLFPAPEEARAMPDAPCRRCGRASGGEAYEGDWVDRGRLAAADRLVQHLACPGTDRRASHIITTGIDITERKRMERALLEISGREQRQIGQDLHDGLGQHLTGIAFMSKVLAQQLRGDGTPAGGSMRARSCAGERGDRQDAGARSRAAAGVLRCRRPDVGAQAMGWRGRGPVPRLLPLRVRTSRS